MFTVLVTNNNELVISQRDRIMERSKLVDKLHFLVNPIYNDLDMSEYDVLLEYVLPISRQYVSEILVKSEELYKDKLEYILPFDTNLTSEPGDIEIQLSFINVINEDESIIEYVRKTSTTTIPIITISKWSDYIPDKALNAVDQKILELKAISNQISENQVDDIMINGNKLQVSTNGIPIGEGVSVLSPTITDDDGTVDGLIQIDDIITNVGG